MMVAVHAEIGVYLGQVGSPLTSPASERRTLFSWQENLPTKMVFLITLKPQLNDFYANSIKMCFLYHSVIGEKKLCKVLCVTAAVADLGFERESFQIIFVGRNSYCLLNQQNMFVE